MAAARRTGDELSRHAGGDHERLAATRARHHRRIARLDRRSPGAGGTGDLHLLAATGALGGASGPLSRSTHRFSAGTGDRYRHGSHPQAARECVDSQTLSATSPGDASKMRTMGAFPFLRGSVSVRMASVAAGHQSLGIGGAPWTVRRRVREKIVGWLTPRPPMNGCSATRISRAWSRWPNAKPSLS
jgi:hypothetical protein